MSAGVYPYAGEQTGPDVAAGSGEPSSPLRIGVGGDYPNGIDGQLSALGLPYQRIFQWELNDPEALGQYDVLFLSCVPEIQPGIDQALLQWLKGGGRAYVETWTAQSRHPLGELVRISRDAPTRGDVVVTEPDHPIAAGLDIAAPIDMYHLQGVCARPTQRDAARILAHYCPDEGREPVANASALLCLPVGEGELVYTGAPLAFARFHRGRSPERLLIGIIKYLMPAGAAPRLMFSEPEDPPPPERRLAENGAPAPHAQAPEVPSLPDGFEFIDRPGDGPYDVLVDAESAEQTDGGPSILLLDGTFDPNGRPERPCLWLAVSPERVELRRGRAPDERPVASADCGLQPSPARLLVRRREKDVSVLLRDAEILRSKVKGDPGGLVAARAGSVVLRDPLCQPVGGPVFSDDFMREPDEPTPWAAVSGEWENVGVGNEDYSINGFYFLGRDDRQALATAGDWFWEDYTFTCAVRLNEPAASCGLCALVQENGDRVTFLADSAERPSAGLRLAAVRGDQESVLAEKSGGLAPEQWYRLGLRAAADALEALIDGEVVLSCPNPDARGGEIGLLVRGGSARFDDVVVQPADGPIRAPRDEGSPAALLPPSLGPHDYMTWASPAEPWVACAERPALFWHEGLFPGDLEVALPVEVVGDPALRRIILAPSVSAPEDTWLSVAIRTSPDSPTAQVSIERPGGRPKSRLIDAREGGELRITRTGRRMSILRDDRRLFEMDSASGPRRIGLEIHGPPVAAEAVRVLSPCVNDYMFGAAPTDWWVSGGTWEVSARWACDNRWSWLAGWGSEEVAIWNKRPINGDVLVEYYVGIKMNAPGGSETQRCRDLNTVLCGDRSDPRSGYSFILGGDGGVKTQLLRNGEVVAENAEVRVPSGYNVHHRWFRVRAARIGHRIELDFEGRPVLRYEDAEPLGGGYVGLWTRNSGILIPRVTIYHSDARLTG